MIKFSEICKQMTITEAGDETKWIEKCKTEAKYCGFEPKIPNVCQKSVGLLDFIYDRK